MSFLLITAMIHIHPVHLGWLAWLSCLSVIFLNIVQRICKSMPKSIRIQTAQQHGHKYHDCPASFAPSQNSCKPPKQLVPPRNDSDPGPGLSTKSQRPADTLDSLCRLQPRQPADRGASLRPATARRPLPRPLRTAASPRRTLRRAAGMSQGPLTAAGPTASPVARRRWRGRRRRGSGR